MPPGKNAVQYVHRLSAFLLNLALVRWIFINKIPFFASRLDIRVRVSNASRFGALLILGYLIVTKKGVYFRA